MKRNTIVIMLAIVAGLVVSEAKAQPPWAPAWGKRRKMAQQEFYYYPSANVYYNVYNRQYIYPRNGVWVSVATPNFNFSFSNMPRYAVYSDGPEVWLNNGYHIERYHGVCHDERYYERGYYGDRYERRGGWHRHRHGDDDDDDDDD
jgi:hypothetical protein